ncbi:MAG: hypothetical protein KAI45_00095 [Melioribacteraceae bacterium]|nr:hypothetical protein [Melioribacteraceae bacterium]
MKSLLKLVSLIGLVVTIVPAFLVFTDVITLSNSKVLMMVGTILWFVSAPFWMNKKV